MGQALCPHHLARAECPRWVAGSTDRCDTLGERLRWPAIEQGLSGRLAELSHDGDELGRAVQERSAPWGSNDAAGGWCFRMSRAATVTWHRRSRRRHRRLAPDVCGRRAPCLDPGLSGRRDRLPSGPVRRDPRRKRAVADQDGVLDLATECRPPVWRARMPVRAASSRSFFSLSRPQSVFSQAEVR